MLRMRLLLATTGAIWLGGCTPSAERQAQCEWESGFRISRDSIGPLATTDPVGVVKELCPQRTRDTVWGVRDWPGIVISIPGGQLIGGQVLEPLKDESRLAFWNVTGDGLLPEGISMKSTWGDLGRAYGSSFGSAGERAPGWAYASAVFDRYPGLSIFLENLDMSELVVDPADIDQILLSSVPDSATIERVYLNPPLVPER